MIIVRVITTRLVVASVTDVELEFVALVNEVGCETVTKSVRVSGKGEEELAVCVESIGPIRVVVTVAHRALGVTISLKIRVTIICGNSQPS